MIFETYDSQEVYIKNKNLIRDINSKIIELTYIKNSLLIYHKNIYLKEINDITKIIKKLTKETIKNIKNCNKMKKSIENLIMALRPICQVINSVKDFLFFKVIYDEIEGKDQGDRFSNGIVKLNEIKNSLMYYNYDFQKI